MTTATVSQPAVWERVDARHWKTRFEGHDSDTWIQLMTHGLIFRVWNADGTESAHLTFTDAVKAAQQHVRDTR